MARKGENIYKRKDGRWEARYIKGYSDTGKAKYASIYASTYAQAKRLRIEALSSKPMDCAADKTLFKSLLSNWLSLQRCKVKASTYSHYCALSESHIIPALGGYPVERLTSNVIGQFVTEKLAHGRIDGKSGLSAKTVQDLLMIIKSVLKFAAKEYGIKNTSQHVPNPKYSSPNIRILSQNERIQLEKYLLQDLDASKLGVYLCLYTGMRLGEICALRWKDINFQTGILSVQRTVQRIKNTGKEKGKTHILIDSPKTCHSIREIPLPSFLLQLLSRLNSHDAESCIVAGGREPYLEPRTYQYRFKKYLKESGLPAYHFHTLRHTFATRCIECGFDIKSLSEILGHASVEITLNRYVHSSIELKRSQMDKLENAA